MDVFKYKVFVKTDSNSIITEINSNIFINNLTDWLQIDEGAGDKYSHAQVNYLKNGLTDMQGRNNYKLVNGNVIELTDNEKEVLFPVKVIETETDLINRLILDNLNMQMQIDTLIQNNL